MFDDSGAPLNADFSIEPEGDGLALVLESSGGRKPGGGVRNADYRAALVVLLRRLGDRRAVLCEALVDSGNVQPLPESQRLVLAGPLSLTPEVDFVQLRHRLTTPQGRIGQQPGASKPGNNSKRLRLRLDVPGYGPQDAARLKRELEGTRLDVVWPSVRVDVADELRVKIGEDVPGVGRVVAVPGDVVVLATANGPVQLRLGEIQEGVDRCAQDGRAPTGKVVGPLVATLTGMSVEDGRTVRAPLKRTVRQFAELDGRVTAKYRKEQGALRSLLVGDDEVAPCALCGRPFPVEFLVAAHVKKRQVATDDERQDLENIAMLACSFGCDKLFELGYVTVGEDGAVLTASTGGPLDLHLELLRGRVTGALHDGSAPYFRWHRKNVFRG